MADIEQQVDATGLKLYEYLDLIGCTGGLIAIMLGILGIVLIKPSANAGTRYDSLPLHHTIIEISSCRDYIILF